MSKTWSRRLQTLYWDASTSLPEQVILNIREIQEAEDDRMYPGLQHLWIDFYEDVMDNQTNQLYTRVRSEAIFSESFNATLEMSPLVDMLMNIVI